VTSGGGLGLHLLALTPSQALGAHSTAKSEDISNKASVEVGNSSRGNILINYIEEEAGKITTHGVANSTVYPSPMIVEECGSSRSSSEEKKR
jgi:hypothetical protein